MNRYVLALLLSSLLQACESDKPLNQLAMPPPVGSKPASAPANIELSSANRQAWFGETHVHTSYSFDAYIYNVRATPDEAYRYAKGQPILHTSGDLLQLSRPLDFMAVTDHAEYLGILSNLADPSHPISKLPMGKDLIGKDKNKADTAFGKLADSLIYSKPIEALRPEAVVKSNWQFLINAAEDNYEPGKFTTLIGYEWTSLPEYNNLHRNVIFRGGTGQVPVLPYSSLDSDKPEDLWRWMDDVRSRGMPLLAIPHNSNLSDGKMFPIETNSWGEPLDARYAEARNRNEPLLEISQIKGTSETMPALSPNDEWANFEVLDGKISVANGKSRPQGSYARRAYLDGLEMAENQGFNPYEFGLIGASDSHNAAATNEEKKYPGKTGISDDTASKRRTMITAGLKARTYSASGLAGVWAEQNTREDIFDGMARKETFGTSGPRIKVRFFGGWNFPADVMTQVNWPALGYSDGVPMGGVLAENTSAAAPTFLVWAQKDPEEAPLQRVQVVKGWVVDGKAQEKIFDVACAGSELPDAQTHRCADNAATVNLTDCSINANGGSVELARRWQDPEFIGGQRAFYYLRAIQNPTCRWSTWDAIANDLPLLKDVPATIQERAWSSPIWYKP